MQALARLETALKRLEAAIEVRTGASATVVALEDDRARLERDRAMLAASLDASEARAERLVATNREVANRLVSVMERLRRIDHGAAVDGPDDPPGGGASPTGEGEP